MTTTDNPKKIKAEVAKQNQENYVADDDDFMTLGGSNRPVDIDNLGKRVLGRAIPENQGIDTVHDIKKRA